MSTQNGQPRERKVKFQGFVSANLNKQEKKRVKDNLLTGEQVAQHINDAAFAGYKISVSFSKAQDCYTATAYGNRWGRPNAGFAMSFRNVDFTTAISALFITLAENGYETAWTDIYGSNGDIDW